MSGYGVEIGQLRAASKAAASAADQAREVRPGTDLGAIATAMPGGESAKGAPALASAFDERAAGWAGEIDRWSESVLSSSKTYAENEDAAERAFGG
ncbi:hypothetical protein [Saccharothrix sp. Mg75]|uniref:hypothetical protein n=1 Tax=Saccharothrix sp. Mg75 TaxID=3445357 RepID=UPI003EE82FEE